METNDNLNAFPKSEFMICTCACKGVLTWYRYDFHTGTTFIPVRLSYLYDFHTGTTFIPVRLSYRYDFHTGTTFIPVRLSYRYDFHTSTTFIPVRLSYRYEFNHNRNLLWPCFCLHDTGSCIGFIPVAVLERHDFVPVRLSYLYEILHVNTP